MLSPRLARIPLLLRGDSHDLAPRTGRFTTAKRLLRRLLFRRFAGFLAVGRAIDAIAGFPAGEARSAMSEAAEFAVSRRF